MTFLQSASARKSIALIDTDWGGHHRFFCNVFAKILLELGHSVVVLCPEPLDASKWLEKQSVKSERLRSFEFHPPEPNTFPIRRIGARLTTLAYWRTAARAIRQIPGGRPPVLTFFPWLDDYLMTGVTHHLIDRIFPHTWSGLYFHPRRLRIPSESISDKVLSAYSALRSTHCRAVAVLDEGVAGKLEDEIGKPVIVFPDLADDTLPDFTFPLLTEIQRRARGRKIVGLLGSLEIRKGLLTLLETALMTAGEPWFYVFAGALPKEHILEDKYATVREIVNTQPENCLFHFGLIPSEEQFNALVEMCDILFAAYLNFTSSSNLLSKAANHRKLLIVSDGYCMAERVKKFRLGITIPEGDVDRCIDALHRLLDRCSIEELRPDFRRYLDEHSLSRLRKEFEAVLENYTLY